MIISYSHRVIHLEFCCVVEGNLMQEYMIRPCNTLLNYTYTHEVVTYPTSFNFHAHKAVSNQNIQHQSKIAVSAKSRQVTMFSIVSYLLLALNSSKKRSVNLFKFDILWQDLTMGSTWVVSCIMLQALPTSIFIFQLKTLYSGIICLPAAQSIGRLYIRAMVDRKWSSWGGGKGYRENGFYHRGAEERFLAGLTLDMSTTLAF